jgi:hypothetical protein
LKKIALRSLGTTNDRAATRTGSRKLWRLTAYITLVKLFEKLCFKLLTSLPRKQILTNYCNSNKSFFKVFIAKRVNSSTHLINFFLSE